MINQFVAQVTIADPTIRMTHSPMTPRRSHKGRLCLRLFRSVALVDLGILVAAGLVSWVIGWRTIYQYCDAVVLGGMIAISIGLWTFWQEWTVNRTLTYLHAQSMTDQDGHKRIRLLRKDDDAGYRFFFALFLAGLVAITIGALLQVGLAHR